MQSILQSLETGDEALWDDQTESGNACLYEMHQMSGRLYKAYKSDNLNAHSVVQSSLPEKLNRAMPHVRTMVIAIRNKDQSRALESGKAALAEMNGVNPSIPSGYPAASKTESAQGLAERQREKAARKNNLMVEARKVSKARAAGGK
ncbi:MAG: hypothetical protein ACLQVN_16730 [Bryobacteraceae bacterium]